MNPQLLKPTLRSGLALLLLLLNLAAPSAQAQNTAVNYLGDLTGNSGPVTGTYDFKFRLFEKESGSPQLGNTVFKTGVPVQNGSFAVTLDFGIVLLPITYFIEVSVKPDGPGDYVLLLPLQKFSPFATAQTADVANLATFANTSGSATTSGYATNAGTANHANSSGTSGFATNANYANTAGYATNSSYATNANHANTSTYATNANHANTSTYATNAGTANYANTSGTAGYATNAGSAGYANYAGFSTNAGYATTAGTALLASNVAPNGVNTAALQNGSVTGEKIPPGTVVRSLNTLTDHVLLEPGANILITQTNQTITVSASAAVGGSGWGFSGNTIASSDFIGTLNSEPFVVRANNEPAFRIEPALDSPNLIGGSAANSATPGAAGVVIAGGGKLTGSHLALGSYAFIGGGWSNSAVELAVVGGGWGNRATGFNSVVAGGVLNVAAGVDAVVSGGWGNLAEGSNSVVAGGVLNVASGVGAVVSGGGKAGPEFFYQDEPNIAPGNYSVISGGRDNYNEGSEGVIAGGFNNEVWSSTGAIIGGGANNSAQANYAVVAGGLGNMAAGANAVVPGGLQNTASGVGSFAAGVNAQATHHHTFVWSDGQSFPGQSTADYQFVIDAEGGVLLTPNTGLRFAADGNFPSDNTDRVLLTFPGASGNLGVNPTEVFFTTSNRFVWNHLENNDPLMHLDDSGLTVNGTFVSLSDRNAKQNIAPLNVGDMLAKVIALPLARWTYKSDTTTAHIGPMAQDFHAAFGVGPDDKHIATVDADGVALAAIQGLNEKVETGKQQAEIQIGALKAENVELRNELSELKQLVQAMSHKLNGGAK